MLVFVFYQFAEYLNKWHSRKGFSGSLTMIERLINVFVSNQIYF